LPKVLFIIWVSYYTRAPAESAEYNVGTFCALWFSGVISTYLLVLVDAKISASFSLRLYRRFNLFTGFEKCIAFIIVYY
jgi:hypothetical protein